ncbi:uncharacterized protein isoform X1 [Danio rerio]|uniref:Uncharacterized protein isoform X1 n=9 Tax=Danio rerio TaxID=7955 RepID=A0A8M6Z897_DANRE|nr:uncharacterized protein LOC101882297 isoform X1 [Danio rerio]|eukprot:XP_017213040.1 uncharacterized protein LOC101882297 isoform X1 [Danio rerio]
MSERAGAHCLQVLCSHLCCWETEHRWARGVKHSSPAPIRKSSSKHLTEQLPSLSVVDVSEWTGWMRAGTERPRVSAETEDASHCKQITHTQKIKRADLSLAESMMPVSSTTNDKQNKIKLNTVEISAVSSSSEFTQHPVFMWIPNLQHQPQRIHTQQSPFPKIAIKELICLPSCQLSKPSKAAGLRQRCTVNKRRAHRCSNSTLEGAGGSRWVGIAFNPIPKPSTHSLSRSFPFRDSGRLNGKLPSLSTQHPKPKHSSGHSSTLSLSLASVKCWRGS